MSMVPFSESVKLPELGFAAVGWTLLTAASSLMRIEGGVHARARQDALIQMADAALYCAKTQGRDRVVSACIRADQPAPVAAVLHDV